MATWSSTCLARRASCERCRGSRAASSSRRKGPASGSSSTRRPCAVTGSSSARAMLGRFAGQVAVVTAAGSGIGAATARRLVGEAAAVVIADLSGTRAEAVASGISKDGRLAAAIKMDASDFEAVQRTIQLALDRFGLLDIMMNDAGLSEAAQSADLS